ncbi:hypothetical protein DPMN_045705 [Dreissena polymorpha]|uniref:Uncharacterized protein n=2 Tax=Dreissena polymorpha TaxID=45954 RepID=A0A9D4HZV7_DREPO|nr:hypothetical protein DPMN_045705 [Dreissena polymorpha]
MQYACRWASSSTSVDTTPTSQTTGSGSTQVFISHLASATLSATISHESPVHTTYTPFTPTTRASKGTEPATSDSVTSGAVYSDQTTDTAEVTSPVIYVTSSDSYGKSPDPNVTSFKPYITSPYLSVPSTHPYVTSPDLSATSPDPYVTSPDRSATSPDPKVTSPDFSATSPDHSTTSPDSHVISPDPKSIFPDPSATSPDPKGTEISTATPTNPETPRGVSSRPAVGATTPDFNSNLVTYVSFSSILQQTNEIRTPPTFSVENITRAVSNTGATLVTNDTDSGSPSDRGLIIGLTIGILLTIILVVGVLVVYFFKRMKQKESVRKNYIRNTNIFYSFPQDHEDTESTASNRHISGNHLNGNATAKIETSDNDTVQNSTVILTLKPEHSHPSLDLYGHHESTHNPLYEPFVDDRTSDSVANNIYTPDTSSETIGFVNDSMQGGGSIARRPAHATKSVTFEASALYAQIVKEGRTKF